MTVREGVPYELTVPLGDFSVEALSEAAGTTCSLEAVVRQSLYYYLANRDGGRLGWPYPRFMPTGAEAGAVVLSLRVDAAAWERFVAEAEAQQVVPELLLRHAVLFFTADVQAGRVARRLLDELS